jgi:uncharacterized C2H2 Zn-finger protein
MADTLVRLLGTLVRDRKTLVRTERKLVRRQVELVKELGRLLQGIGYELRPIRGGKARAAASAGAANSEARKPLMCPKCDRRFAHPLPLARHVSASHTRKKARGTRRRTKKAKG